MTFQAELILATLSEWQGTTLTAEQMAEVINCSDVNSVRRSLDYLADAHYPVTKTDEGYSIPKDTAAQYIVGLGLFASALSASLFLL